MLEIWNKSIKHQFIIFFNFLFLQQMTNQIDLKQFNQTPIVKKLRKSKSTEKLNELDKPIPETKIQNKRGRKSKYTTDEERKEARRKQQREYRLRKKQELEKLREMVKDKQE